MPEPENGNGGLSPTKSKSLAVVGIFSALIAVGTIISIPLPYPLYELTWSPAIILALAVLVDSVTAFDATAIGSFVGEAINVGFRGGSPIYPFGIVWARAPEVFIVAWARQKGTRALVVAMVGATVFETLAFFFSDWHSTLMGSSNTGRPQMSRLRLHSHPSILAPCSIWPSFLWRLS
jgi:hypothetical protein